MHQQLEEYSSQTFDTKNPSPIYRILAKTGAPDIASAKSTLVAEIAVTKEVIARDVVLLIVLSTIPFVVCGLSRSPLSRLRFFLLLPPLLMLLAGGVSTPAIDLEAKISQMRFILLAHPIQFENQILYFKSKSILQIFRIMMSYEDFQMKVVAVLLITFSVIFPLLKIVASTAHYVDFHHARRNRVIEFFVVHSGKWSMADVMVVAMFMAYIGFDGVVTNQLDELNAIIQSQDLAILTTNGTALQPGFYLFLAYTLLALVFSGFLTRTSRLA